MNRMSIKDCIVFGKSSKPLSEYVVIDSDRMNEARGFVKAYEGGYLTHVGLGLYKCKRIVADNLGLTIVSEYPIIIK